MCCQDEKLKIVWSKSKPDAKTPKRAENSGGYDIYACFEEDYILIPPHTNKVIPTGVHSHFNYDYVALVEERGSTGIKNMARRAGVIDGNYTGEWMVIINNTNDFPIIIAKEAINYGCKDGVIYPYEKAIAQALFLKVPVAEEEEISYEEYQKIETNRGDGRLGSSNH